MSRLLLRTLRDAPSDAEAASHKLLVRAGYIRRLASGIYTFLPLGARVLHNLTRIVREEMDRAGAQEMLMPVLSPEDLWETTGRRQTMDDVLFLTEGSGGRFVLGPTHEEVVTTTVSAEVESWRDLPLTVYQIQTKFRDEPRPRYGLVRGREFVMKDAYSFDADPEGMTASYAAMHKAYCRVFERCGLDATPVEASSGTMGGDVNHEFMVPSDIGEGFFVQCAKCGYAANTEVAQSGPRDDGRPPAESTELLVEHHTPDRPGIDLVVEFFSDRGLTAAGMLKCIAFAEEDRVVVALVPGDRDVREVAGLRAFEDSDFAAHPGLVKGYIGPMGLQGEGVRVVGDHAVRVGGPWVTGANRADHHVSGATLGRDFEVDEWLSLATVADGDPCAECGEPLKVTRAVEAGHIFQNGLVYSAKIPGATFLDASGSEKPFWMGCYGIGISRTLAVVAEENCDEHGLVWPEPVAPYRVQLLVLGGSRAPEVIAEADKLYGQLVAAGVETLYDDRDASPGVKFADADLIGLPIQLIVGAKGLARGVVERKIRATGDRDEVQIGEIVEALR